MTDDIMISVRGLTKIFPGSETPAVSELSLDIPRGEIVVLVGPSGCGKTTTLKMINRVIEPTSGTVLINGEDATAMEPHLLRRKIGYVIQQIGLFPHRTIAQNIGTVPRLLGWDEGRVEARVAELIETVGLEPELARRYPSELSGGQQQRVGVARALAADPPVLLMDEPFGAVDPIVRSRLQSELLDLQKTLRKTIVFVTHDIDEAVRLGDRIALLNVGGILEQYSSPFELLQSPANEFVAEFLGSDRGLKRLSLMPIAGVPLTAGPVVSPGTSSDVARGLMAKMGVNWIGVAAGTRLYGWVNGADLGDTVRAEDARRFGSWLPNAANLREALDVIVSGHTPFVPVLDGEQYLGMLTVERISEEMRK